jgi:heterodisulfide reductase subunit A-like polyferredoxin
VGSRSEEHPWCSRTCCADTLRNAIRLRREDPSADVTILHRGIRVWGFDEELLSEAIERGVSFIEVADTASVEVDGGVRVVARATDGEAVTMTPDVVALSTGVEPSRWTGDVARVIGAELAGDGFFGSAGRVACGEAAGLGVEVCGRAAGAAEVEERVIQAQAAAGRACLHVKRGNDEA